MKRLLLLLLCVTLLSTVSCAYAVDTSRGNRTSQRLSHCKIMTLDSNEYNGTRPLIIFFPGSGEVDDLGNAIGFIEKYNLYKEYDIDLLVCCLPSRTGNHHDFEKAVADVYEYLLPYYNALGEDELFPIIIDAVSFGGYGGCYCLEYFMERGMWVDELNLADACGSYCIHSDWVRELSQLGAKVNVFAATGSGDISQNTRKIINELEAEYLPHFYGNIFYVNHGAVLAEAIHEDELHIKYYNNNEAEF